MRKNHLNGELGFLPECRNQGMCKALSAGEVLILMHCSRIDVCSVIKLIIIVIAKGINARAGQQYEWFSPCVCHTVFIIPHVATILVGKGNSGPSRYLPCLLNLG